jgi:hypothetical protein
MKAMLVLLLLIFNISLALGEDLSCEPVPESEVEKLVKSLTDRFRSEKINSQFCRQIIKCYRSENEGAEEYEDAEDYCDEEGSEEELQYVLDASQGTCNLTRQERFALGNYMGDLYQCLNRALYTGHGQQFSAVTNSLNSALRKFPKYEGFVLRGSNLPANILNRHRVGETVTYPAYTSTSTNRYIADAFGDEGQLFLIYSRTGRPVMGLAQDENEVLFKAGTRFRVLKAEKNKFIMREVTGQESSTQAKAEDKRVLALAQEASKAQAQTNSQTESSEEQDNPDVWSCPLNNQKIPALLRQKTVPRLSDFFPAPAPTPATPQEASR